MESEQNQQQIQVQEKEYKTPIYFRKCYKKYYDKNKDNEDFKAKRREQQRKYYQENKQKVIARVKQYQAKLLEKV